MNRITKLKEDLAKGKLICGGAVMIPNPISVEILGYTGMDYVYIDTEHVPIGSDLHLQTLIMAAEVSGVTPIVRVKENQEHFIRNALEAGAKGIVVPHVATRKQAEKAVKYSRFPLEGIRGAMTLCRSAKWGIGLNWAEYTRKSNKEVMVILMMEDKEFIDNIDDILTVDGIDSLSFGPGDYSLSIGVEPDDSKVDEAFQFLVEKAKSKNLPVLTAVIPPTFEQSKKLFEMGINFQLLGADIAFIASGFEGIMNDIIRKLR